MFKQNLHITFSKAAQWVDENAYQLRTDESQLCEYLYHVIRIYIQRNGIVKDFNDVEDFILYCVSKLLLRFRNKDDSKPIKSISNYLRIVMSPWYAEYLTEFKGINSNITLEDFDITDFSDYLIDVTSEQDYKSYYFDCDKVSDVIKKHLRRIPKKKNSPEWSNIYLSCLLTLQNRLLSSYRELKLNDENNDLILQDRVIRSIKTVRPILYHIPEESSSYVNVLVNEITHAVASELTRATSAKVTVSDCLANLVAAASNEEEED